MSELENVEARLKALADGYCADRDAIRQAEKLRESLTAEVESRRGRLAGLGLDELRAPDDEKAGHFDPGTRREIQALRDCELKLDLLPGVRAKAAAKLEGARIEIKRLVRGLMRSYAELAEAKVEEARALLGEAHRKFVLTGPVELDKSIIVALMHSDPWHWREAFRFYGHQDDPAEDARGALSLVERFAKGEACPYASPPQDLTLGLTAAAEARELARARAK